ncbi:MAG: hypothetical protein ACJ735_02470 [Actinomycetes bacterium]
MGRNVALGLLAGGAGTAALNLVTYLDMATRGRPPSELPEQAVTLGTEKANVRLGDEDHADNRKRALGALLGYVTGLGVGAAFGALRAHWRVPTGAAAGLLGLGAMAASDVPMTAAGLTNPRTWRAQDWLSDLIPHLAYGAITALTYEAMAGR